MTVPEGRQVENHRHGGGSRPGGPEVGRAIHDAWLARGRWTAGGELDVDFEDLPEDEQAEDMAQIRSALSVVGR